MILITGATGFIGCHVVTRFLADERHNLRLLLMESERDLAGEFPGAEILFGDISNPEILEKAAAGTRSILHLASKNIDIDGTGFDRINVEGTKLLCNAAIGAGVEKIIYLSTVGVYGHRRHRNADESTPVKPDTAFSRSKAEAESIILDHHRAGRLKGIILRHRFIYGQGDMHVIGRMIKAAQKYPFLIGGGHARISLISADDLADILLRFTQTDESADSYPVYHTTDGFPIEYGELIRFLCDTYGLNPPRFNVPYWPLYLPVRFREWITGTDPETAKSSLTSMRLKLVGLENTFTNTKLIQRFPDLQFSPFSDVFPRYLEFYRQFVDQT
jgi:nucleoside-diphosphate-sugar epimerase